MNRTERRFIARAIKIAAKRLAGAPPQVIEQVMGEEIERAIQYASDEEKGDLGVDVTDVVLARGSAGIPSIPQPDADPASYPRDEIRMPDHPQPPVAPVPEPRRLILVPGDEGFESKAHGKPEVGTRTPLALWTDPRPDESLTSEEYQVRWQEAISTLVHLVNANLPPFFQVVPTGASGPITIDRINVISDVPVGIVKAIYGLKNQNTPTPAPSGEVMPAMNIDRIVQSMFSVRDKSVNWEQRIQDLKSQCEDVFKPRPRELVNHTPPPRPDILSPTPGNAGGYAESSNDPHKDLIFVDSAVRTPGAAASTDPEYQQFLKWKQQQQRGPRVPSLLE